MYIIIIIKGLRPPSDSSNSYLEREVIHCHLHAIMKKERKQETENKTAFLKFTALFLTFPLKANILMQNSTDEQTKCNSRCDSFILHLGHVVVSFVCIELSIKCVKVLI